MNIRQAKVEDIETLFNIRTSVIENYQSCEDLANLGITPETVAEMLLTDCRAWIAEIDDRPIGFSMANASEKTIFAMFVLPSFAGRGAGRALMEQAEDWLWLQEGIEEIWLLTGNDPKIRAYGFYLHLGWMPTDIQPDGQIKFIKRRA